jgi:tetratricopeptide (TPR) repeat protein
VIAPLALGLLLAAAQATPAPVVPTPAPASPATAASFEALWSEYVAADGTGKAEAVAAALRDIRRARMERNVESLGSVGLAFVAHGAAKLAAGQREEAEQVFRTAVALAPGLPDAHAGLAKALLKKGPLGVLPSIDATLGGLSAFLATGRGTQNARELWTLGALFAAFAAAWAIALALLLRRGGLLRHDIEEWLGPAHNRSAALALLLLVLLLPVATFQGWGWLPLWWLALLFAYLDLRERALVFLLAACALVVGPSVSLLEERLRTARNPLYHAALAATESVPDAAAIARLEAARQLDPADRDLDYLVGAARKRAGRYEDAAELYRQTLAADPGDAVARNNLANIEFVRGSYDSARARYRAGTGSSLPEVAATSYYNLSLAHLQKFEYQDYNAAKSSADRVAPGLVSDYDRWRYDTGDYAVVDLGLSRETLWDKFRGAESGVAARNLLHGGVAARPEWFPGALVNRFVVSLAVLALAALVVARWRGRKAFTLHCRRCGTPFCRLCHLGQATGGLCSQCYHLFVVRDGVSAPVRNRKLADVQRADARRDRVMRILSIVSPGTGQLYAGWTLLGALVVIAWYGILGLVAASRVVPFTEVAPLLAPPWFALAAGLALAALWLTANRLRAAPSVDLPRAQPKPRARSSQAGAS